MNLKIINGKKMKLKFIWQKISSEEKRCTRYIVILVRINEVFRAFHGLFWSVVVVVVDVVVVVVVVVEREPTIKSNVIHENRSSDLHLRAYVFLIFFLYLKYFFYNFFYFYLWIFHVNFFPFLLDSEIISNTSVEALCVGAANSSRVDSRGSCSTACQQGCVFICIIHDRYFNYYVLYTILYPFVVSTWLQEKSTPKYFIVFFLFFNK